MHPFFTSMTWVILGVASGLWLFIFLLMLLINSRQHRKDQNLKKAVQELIEILEQEELESRKLSDLPNQLDNYGLELQIDLSEKPIVNQDNEGFEDESDTTYHVQHDKLPLQNVTVKQEPVTAFHLAYQNYQACTGYSLIETLKNKGDRGELQTYTTLGNHFGYEFIFSNVYLPMRNGETSQVDLIYLTPSEIYLIENKNFKGSVYGVETDQKWTQNINGRTYRFHNPILQNQGHCYAFRGLFYAIPPNRIIPIVVFNNLCQLTVTVDTIVLNRNQLVDTIQKRQEKANDYFSKNDLYKMSVILTKYSLPNEIVVQRHIQYAQSKRQ